jgi:hypothetical protein
MAYDIEQVLINEANRIGPDIYRKTLNTSPWLKLVKKDVWPDEMGDTIRVLTYERSLPSNALSWNRISIDPIQATDGSYANGASVANGTGFGNNAVPNAQVINFAQTLRAYNLTQTALESPKLSVNDLRFSLKRKEQLSNIFAILQENTSYAWQERYRDEYVRIAQNKISAAVNGSTGALVQNSGDGVNFDSTSSTLPASILVQGILDRVYMKLIRDGAGNNPLDRENSRPVFGAILSSEASRNLIAANPDIRQDYRWSSKVNELLSPLGIERSYAGFFHMVDDWGPRHDVVTITSVSSGSAIVTANSGDLVVGDQVSGNGIALGTVVTAVSGANVTLSQNVTGATGTKVYVRRLPYAAVATTQGYKFDINVKYETAQFEDTIIFHQDVFSNLVPKPITAAGSNVTFDAVSYMGDFKWKNIITPDTNPDGTIGYFRAILSSGSKPIRPEWGYVIRHLRASTPLVLDAVYHGSAEVIAQPTMSYTSDGSGYQPGVSA